MKGNDMKKGYQDTRIDFIKKTSLDLQNQLKDSMIVAYRPDHPFLFSGPDILVGGGGRLIAVFVPKVSEKYNSKEIYARLIAAKLALPHHTIYIYISQSTEFEQISNVTMHFHEVFGSSETSNLVNYIKRHEANHKVSDDLLFAKSEAMICYGIMLDLSRVNARRVNRAKSENLDIDFEQKISGLNDTKESPYIKSFKKTLVGIRKFGKNTSFTEVVNSYSVKLFTRDYALDDGIPYRKERTPNLIVLDKIPTARFDPDKPVRTAAFAGWAVKLLVESESLTQYTRNAGQIRAFASDTHQKCEDKMSSHSARVDTIRAMIAGCSAISSSIKSSEIDKEWQEVKKLSSVSHVRRRYLLSVLHSTRALDDTLKVFVTHHGLSRARYGTLGSSLKCLAAAPSGKFSAPFTLQAHFQSTIADSRNKYMHQAGAYPGSDREIRVLISEMEHCISVVVAL
jgi:hypothetical protein